MLGVAVNFVVLYGIVWLFERKRSELDAGSIATAVIIPVIVLILFRVAAYFLGLGVVGDISSPILYLLVTFFVLWKLLEIPVGRSATYSIALFVVNVGLAMVLIPE